MNPLSSLRPLRRLVSLFCLFTAALTAFAAESDVNPSAVTTFECAGLYWKTDVGGECTVRYRAQGTSEWREALPLVAVPHEREYRGSIVGLSPDTAYEAELSADGRRATVSFRTRSDNFPVGKTTVVPAGENRTTITITESGTPEAYHLVTVAPGTRATIELRNTAVAGVEVDADYVIIRGLEIRNAAQHGIRIADHRHDIVVEQCHVIGWGRGGGSSSFGGFGNVDSGVMAGPGTRNLTIQRNLFEHPRGSSNDWDSGHPAGPQGISIFHSLGGNVIRYNEIWSSDAHAFNDGIGGGGNFSEVGNMNRDSDIYGNIVRNVWDDALEIEGANKNVRIWGNYLEHFFVGIATASTSHGPLYIFRNVAGPSRRTARDRIGGRFIKTGDREFGGGRRLVFHNTVLQPNGVQNIISAPTSNIVTRNNIFDAPGEFAPAPAEKDAVGNGRPGTEIPGDYDYDLFSGADRGVATEPHGLVSSRLRPAYVASYGLEFYPASTFIGPGGGKVMVTFGDQERLITNPVFQLRNPVIDGGVRLPGFNDDFTGKAPDLGAFEIGRPPLEFGRRAYLKYDEGWAPWERY